MKLLVIGSGGREHAICWQFLKSSKLEKIYCAPGNGGIAQIAEIVDIEVTNFDKLADFVKSNGIDFTFVGPEVPLSLGIVDYFQLKGLKIFGPSKNAARLESSKIYSKEFMQKHRILTASYNSFSNVDDALKFLENWGKNKKAVVKADGLAAGKGVYMCNGKKDAEKAVKHIMNDKVLGSAGKNIIIEEYINGPELSYLVFTDGISYSIMPALQDHKRVDEYDRGPNTGGMGAYAPAPLATDEINKKVEDIVCKVVNGIKAEKLDYKGVLYVGIIMNESSPYVLEFNCRFGDPETQSVLPLLDTDLIDICTAILNQSLSNIKINWKRKFSVCVVLASGGYPGRFKKGFEIKGLENINDENTIVFHAGTKRKNVKFLTSGGRVLGITSVAEDIKSAIDKVYSSVKKVNFENMHYRRDVACKALNGKRRIDVAIIAGSVSDLGLINETIKILRGFDLSYSLNIASAHRTAKHLKQCIDNAESSEVKVFIAAAGMSAALPGVIASSTILPVIGIPVAGKNLSGLDSLFSIVQMPKGIPVATVAVDKAGAVNAAILAVQIIAVSDNTLRDKLKIYKIKLAEDVVKEDFRLQKDGIGKYVESVKK
ncbi:MAG: phosphoribosylamine--glycine ligase [Endomicrobium sp.]|nr:phosphoribosylamine--glycine ligase [Endomicrobium sp.]